MIRMIRCRAETRPAMDLAKKWNGKRAGEIVARLFRSDADIIPEQDKGIPRVRILGSAGEYDDVVAAELLKELAREKAVQPGTNLRLVCELPPNRANQGSNTLNRCPNV